MRGTFNGLTFGAGTPYRMTEITGLLDSPGVRTGDRDRARANGQFSGSDYLEGRSVQVEFRIMAPGVDSQIIGAFNRAMRPTVEGDLELVVDGLADDREVQITGKVRRRGVPVNRSDYKAGAPVARVEWWCCDPLIYDSAESELGTSVADTSGAGEEWPFEWPIDWGGEASGGTVTAVNEGDTPTPWTATLYGPLVSPRIENAGTGEVLRFDGTIAVGETLVVNSRDRSVMLGAASRYDWLRPASRWFDLQPGNTTVRLAASGGAGSMSLRFRSAWS